jgi:hypothetical protein
MFHLLKNTISLLFLGLFIKLSYANPWFTGPIFAPSGHTIPSGHTNFELYGLGVFTNGQYDNQGHLHPIPLFKSLLFSPLLTHGFAKRLDIQFTVPYVFNNTQGVSYHRLTDTSTGLGIQLLEQSSKNRPDIRLYLQETFPTGKFENLNPAFLGTDATGLGSYRTLISLNFQYLNELYKDHYLRTRLFLSTLISSAVNVHGFNSFGGAINTDGIINPGSEENIDLAFEYTLTQRWVLVMEGYYSEGQATRFNGILDIVSDDALIIGNQHYYEYGLAPAIEYNFSSTLGLIGGIWFPVQGKNTSRFVSYVLAINAYW